MAECRWELCVLLCVLLRDVLTDVAALGSTRLLPPSVCGLGVWAQLQFRCGWSGEPSLPQVVGRIHLLLV